MCALVAAVAVLALTGCGEDGTEDGSQADTQPPEPAGTLGIAMRTGIDTLDPLFARGRAERLAARQVHEPLVSHQVGPFGEGRRKPGLASSVQSSAGDTIWTTRLRRGVRFQNGEPLDADAVLDNVQRWMNAVPASPVVPQLAAADSPRPGLVRFLLDSPASRFARTLGSARLGLVAPEALADAGSGPVKPGPTGTGPFEYREQTSDEVLLARHASWWGSQLDLGPGLDQLEFLAVPKATMRAEALRTGTVEVAGALEADLARRVRRNPLLTTVPGRGLPMGLARSVRGIESAAADQSLSDAWLTDLR